MLRWTEELATRIDVIDTQHKELIKQINVLENSDFSKLDAKELEKFVRFIGGYVIEHFITEEEIMLKYNYPGYDAHKAAHMDLLRNYTSLKRHFAEEKSPCLMLVVIRSHFLDWLSDHIRNFDMEMAKFLKSHGNRTSSYIQPIQRESPAAKSLN